MGSNFVFTKANYKLMAIGLVAVLVGFLLMVGGASDDPDVFDYDALFSFRRITLAPILVIGGYVVVIFAIMKRPKNDDNTIVEGKSQEEAEEA